MDRFGGGCMCINSEDGPAILTIITVVASAAAVTSILLKVSWGSASRS